MGDPELSMVTRASVLQDEGKEDAMGWGGFFFSFLKKKMAGPGCPTSPWGNCDSFMDKLFTVHLDNCSVGFLPKREVHGSEMGGVPHIRPKVFY